MIIPENIIKHFPKAYRDNPDAAMIALANKIDSIMQDINTDIVGINFFKNPDRIPSIYLNEIGFLLNANLTNYDSDVIKRRKISNAIQAHKKRGTWEDDAKIKIDNITGYDARIFRSIDSSDWILMGYETGDPTYYWGSLGVDGVDYSLGLDLIGAGDEVVIAGNIYINCHYGITSSTLTAGQIAQIVYEISFDIIPAYMKIFLGYLDGTGAFNVYSGGIIG